MHNHIPITQDNLRDIINLPHLVVPNPGYIILLSPLVNHYNQQDTQIKIIQMIDQLMVILHMLRNIVMPFLGKTYVPNIPNLGVNKILFTQTIGEDLMDFRRMREGGVNRMSMGLMRIERGGLGGKGMRGDGGGKKLEEDIGMSIEDRSNPDTWSEGVIFQKISSKIYEEI
jgi:hypothetical protein